MINYVGNIAGAIKDANHVAIQIQDNLYTLTGDGFEVFSCKEYVPLRSYLVGIADPCVRNLYDIRMYEYAMHRYHVSLQSLVKAWLQPDWSHFGLCTSFVSFVLWNEINPVVCNSMIRFEEHVKQKAFTYSTP